MAPSSQGMAGSIDGRHGEKSHWQRLRDYVRAPRRGALLAALFALALLLPLWWQAGRWQRSQLLQEQRTEATLAASLRASALSSAVQRHLAHVQGLHAFVQAEGYDARFGARWKAFARGLFAANPGVRAYEVAPAGIVRYVFPVTGEAAGAGYEPLDPGPPDVAAATEQTLATGQIVLSSPFEEAAGEPPSLIARQAVYIDGVYWGLVTVILDLPELLAEAALDGETDDFSFALRDTSGRLLYGTEEVYGRDPILTRIELPGGGWELLSAPTGGWPAAVRGSLQRFQAAGLVFVGLLAGLVYLSVNRQGHLAQAVRERTRELDSLNAQLQRDIAESKQVEAALREREHQYRSVFESVSDALFINDLEGRLIDFNPAAAEMHGYTGEEFAGIQPAQFIHPDSLHLFGEYMQSVQAGSTYRTRAFDVRKDGTVFPVEVLGTLFSYHGRPHTLAVVRDITEQVRGEQLLEERIAERTRELSTLIAVAQNVTSTLTLDELMGQVLCQLKVVVEYTSSSIFKLHGDSELMILDYQGPLPHERALAEPYWIIPGAGFEAVIQRREPVIISDIWGDAPMARAMQAALGEMWRENYGDTHTWMGVPLIVQDRLIGLLSLNYQEPDFYTEQHARLALAFANHAAVAIENARLFEAEQGRAEQFRLLNKVSHRITSILSVDELLSQTSQLVRDIFGYYHVHTGLVEGDLVRFTAAGGVWWDQPRCEHCEPIHIRVGQDGMSGRVAATGQALLAPDVTRDPHYIPTRAGQSGSALVLPLQVKGRVIGVLNVESEQLNGFAETDLIVLQSLANQLAVALENARLYEQTRRLAVLEERQRLARELHDSVSQALYGIGLGARTARVLLDRDHGGGQLGLALKEPLDYVLSLADAGLAEMRALIFELRPDSLEQEGIVAALTKQTDALRARHKLAVELSVGVEPDLPFEVKEALYRITQEALHNVVKHAQASCVCVRLEERVDAVLLEVQDDGVGFDPQADFPGHLGLHSMRERAGQVGGQLTIESAPGCGALLRVRIPTLVPVRNGEKP